MVRWARPLQWLEMDPGRAANLGLKGWRSEAALSRIAATQTKGQTREAVGFDGRFLHRVACYLCRLPDKWCFITVFLHFVLALHSACACS